MTDKLLQVVLMLAVTFVLSGLSFLFAGIISFGFRQFANYLFLACCVAILALDTLWMRRVFLATPLAQDGGRRCLRPVADTPDRHPDAGGTPATS